MNLKNFKNVSIKIKLLGLMGLSIFVLVLVGGLFYNGMHDMENYSLKAIGEIMMTEKRTAIQSITHAVGMDLAESLKDIEGLEAKKLYIQAHLAKVRYGEADSQNPNGREYLFANVRTRVLYNPSKKLKPGDELRDKAPFVADLFKKAQKGGGFSEYEWSKPGVEGKVPKLGYAEFIPGLEKEGIIIGTGIYIDDVDAQKAQIKKEMDEKTNSLVLKIVLIAGVITALILLASYFLISVISRSLIDTVSRIRDIAEGEGDLTQRLEVKSDDEIGRLAHWFNTFIEKLQGIIGEIDAETKGVNNSADELKTAASETAELVQGTADKSVAVATASEEMSSSMTSVAASMEQASANTDGVATAVQEMTSTISEIAQNAEKAREISNSAVQRVGDSTETMNRLGVAAKEIGQVVETITDISEQVNLLSLNATIEAARAGEAGKGFAVVANEIKELARQTAEASQDIKEKVENIQNGSTSALGGMQEVAGVISEVNEVVSTIAAAVEEQSSATNEIANNVEQLAIGIQDVTGNVAQGSQVASEISESIAGVSDAGGKISEKSGIVQDSASGLKGRAGKLAEIVGQFKI